MNEKLEQVRQITKKYGQEQLIKEYNKIKIIKCFNIQKQENEIKENIKESKKIISTIGETDIF